MANTKSAKKMVRKIEKRTIVNRMRRSMVRTSVKKAELLIDAGDKAVSYTHLTLPTILLV